MISKHLVDTEILPALDLIPTVNFDLDILPAIRLGMSEQLFSAPPLPDDLPVVIEQVTIAGHDSSHPIRIMIHRPTNINGIVPAIFHIHGGGYVVGAPDMMDAAHRELAVDLGCAILSVDYRLAPETPFPGAVEDCYAALRWITLNAEQLFIDPTRIGVKGESAGGGLAACLALLVRDRGELSLAFQHLIYPMLDDRTCVTQDPHPFTGEFIWTPENNAFGWSSLLGTAPGAAEISLYAAAARADDLSGLPPSFISVGALDLFVEEDMDYARRLMRAGVPVELHVYPGAFHGFNMAQAARVSIAAERDSRDALRRAFYG